ncbi:MAG TPA: YihY/virulence factor BrkB family protein [Gammaproteobacteria bacterium]|nr:YihY/virulence factor BrkB family protein [Gammaproteobacteria bacterium]
MYRGITFRQFLVDLNREISEDNVFVGAAALGYYLTLAIFPALILLMTIIPYLPVANIDQEIMSVLETALPEDAFSMVSRVVEEVTSQRRGGLLSFGVLGTLWAASTGMYAIMQQLNITYDVSEARSYIRARAVALALSIMFGLLVIGAFWLIVAGGAAEDWLGEQRGIPDFLLTIFAVFRWIVIVLALLLGFALIYKFAPNVEQKFRFITPGSVIGVLLLIIASLGFAIYVANFADYSATYGSIGAVIILMFWLYIAGLVILVGSEINALIEHYSPEGKRKGEKTEGERPGGPLHDAGD